MSTDDTSPRAMVVGIGAITAQGPTAKDLWDGVAGSRNAIRPVQHMSMADYRTRLAGEVQQTVPEAKDAGYPEGHRDRALEFALVAADEAMSGCAEVRAAVPAERWALVLSTCNAGLLSAEQWYSGRRAGEEPDARLLTFSTPQGLAEAVAGCYGVRGPVHSINTACAAGANAVGHAADLIRSGQADAVLTGGTDALSDVLVAGFHSLESLSPEPAAPYSKNRQGLSLGEGSGMLVLVRDDLAAELGIGMLAEVVSLGLSADGYHATAPHPEGFGAGSAIRQALHAAGLGAEDIDYVNSHGTGTQKNDVAETLAIKYGLGESAYRTAVSSSKSTIGHLLGAAGAVEAIITIQALGHQVAPPTANLDEAAIECDLDYVPNVARPTAIDVAMSNNFAFGGANASLVLSRERRPVVPTPPVERVVVTGVGTLTSAGTGAEALWQAYAEGQICTADEDGARIGRMVLDGVQGRLTPKARRRMDRICLVSVLSSGLALEDAGLAIGEDNRKRVGTILGTGVGPMESMERFSEPVINEGARAANPGVFPNTVYNAAAGQVAMNLGVLGPTTTLTSGHAAGAAAIDYCAELLSLDQADAMLAVSADTLTDTVIAGYRSLDLLGPGGLALAEAGIALLLERRMAASERGATPLGEYLGHADTHDGLGAGHWDAQGRGLERAMRSAVQRAGLELGDVTAVWSSMSGHGNADAAERSAIERVFPQGVRVHSPQLALGQPIGAGAAVNAVLAMMSWRNGAPAGPVLVNSSSLGGSHVCTVLAPPDGSDAL